MTTGTERLVENLDRVEAVAQAIYEFDCSNVEGKGDTMPPDEWNIRAHKCVPFAEAHGLIRRLYHGRALAALAARTP